MALGILSCPVASPLIPQSHAAIVTNSATGTYNGLPLNTSNATVSIDVTGPLVTVADPLFSTVTDDRNIVIANGSDFATFTATLLNGSQVPVPGKTVTYSSDRGLIDTFVQPAAPTGADGVAVGRLSSMTVGAATVTTTDVTDSLDLTTQLVVYFSQGQVLRLEKVANKQEAVVGDVVTYQVEIFNTTTQAVQQVNLDDMMPPNFKYLGGSARLNGAPVSDPSGNQTSRFAIGTVPALVDANGNGRADPGEQGYMRLTYQMIIGSGAAPGDYVNTVQARDVCDLCLISNAADATVTVTLDPLFDLGTIIGKVFEDTDKDGIQDEAEAGVGSAMVALDDGTYVMTDEHGRFHFPLVTPGQRMLKINLLGLDGAMATTDESVVLTMTPGLLAKANFGVNYSYGTETIGRAAVKGVSIDGAGSDKTVSIAGSVESLTLLVNGDRIDLPVNNIQFGDDTVEDVLEIRGGRLSKPATFRYSIARNDQVQHWQLEIADDQGAVVRTVMGEGSVPDALGWDGMDDAGSLVPGGRKYYYQMRVDYQDGSHNTTARRTFGVNRTEMVSLSMAGGAFAEGSDQLQPKARELLDQISGILHNYPDEKVLIEGHTDSQGLAAYNMELSRRRAESAARYLQETHGISEQQLSVHWYGEERPIASNDLEVGRELNRRVEIKGQFNDEYKIQLADHYRTAPKVVINDKALEVDERGHFSMQWPIESQETLSIEMVNRQGQSVQGVIAIPQLAIRSPLEKTDLAYGTENEFYLVSTGPVDKPSGKAVMKYRLQGYTDPGSRLSVNGIDVAVDRDGQFSHDVPLAVGRNQVSLLAGNDRGYARVKDLAFNVTDRDEYGHELLLVEPVPHLTVKMPPREGARSGTVQAISGKTAPGNRILINGEPVEVKPDGNFSTALTLAKGINHVTIHVVDAEGYAGSVERDFEVSDQKLFLLAFADGKISQLQTSGYLPGTGLDSGSGFYAEGRVAYYLKGMIAGKYLITSAYDSGMLGDGGYFTDLDEDQSQRLLTNLDPNKLYPVYGDSSTLVHDVQSQGKFYLAVDSDELNLVVGNYPLSFNGTELATYQRTLYGIKAHYHSLASSPFGQPDTEVVVFGAEISQAHIEDELRATGGSLYYLSHGDIIEGSEQITLVIRDKNTGLPLQRITRQRNSDYRIYYDQGRILFTTPVSSVVQDNSLVNQQLLGGNPVYIQVDYEARLDSFEKNSYGGRVRKQLGDQVAVGGTYLHDESNAGNYDLQGVDAELRLSRGVRILAELADSSGEDARRYTSDDGGLSYSATASGAGNTGQAWKLAVQADIGAWLDHPGMVVVGAYIKQLEQGFMSNGNALEQGTQKAGVNVEVKPTGQDQIRGRYDVENIDAATGTALAESVQSSLQWQREMNSWAITAEYQDTESKSAIGEVISSNSYLASQIKYRFSDQLNTFLTHQLTLTGADNDQTTVGMAYSPSSWLTVQAKATEGTQGQAAELGVALNSGEDVRIYLSERVSEDQAGLDTTSTIVGSESNIGRQVKIYNEYQWQHSGTNDSQISLLGVQRQWDIREGVNLQLRAEQSKISSTATQNDRHTLASVLSYDNKSGLLASTKNEWRREKGTDDREQYLTVNHLELKLHPDYTLLGKYRYSLTRDLDLDAVEARFDERSLGVAYRPVQHDQLNLLARYTGISDQRPLNLAGVDAEQTAMDVVSVEWSYMLSDRLEWVEKEAMRRKEEVTNGYDPLTTNTLLSIHRLNYQFRKAWDVGVEYRTLAQREANDQRNGWLSELMWKANKHVRVGAGYNFTDFSDNEFSNNDYSVRGVFIRLQGKY